MAVFKSSSNSFNLKLLLGFIDISGFITVVMTKIGLKAAPGILSEPSEED